ncbi:MAG: hypothetical protein AB8G05_20360 [Oligoflexales bacterium]
MTTAVFIVLCLLVFAIAIFLWWRLQKYEQAYRDLIQRCSEFVGFATNVAKKISETDDPYKVQQVESLVSSFESLAASLQRLPKKGFRIERIEMFRIIMRDLAHGFFHLFRLVSGENPGICYACSRPDVPLQNLKFWWKGSTGAYGCCQSCHRLFSLKKRLQVLCFMGQSQPEHWSEFLDYHPQKHFKDLEKGVTPSSLQRCDLVVFCSQKEVKK